jgi:hypothetical protein
MEVTMKITSKLLLGLALLQGVAHAADEPSIEVIDGRISITAHAVPLGRFLALFDKAMGMKSEIKPGLESRNVSVQFTDLDFNAAIRKIFQGQPYNYIVTAGKGIKITDLAQAGGADSAPAFTASQPLSSPINTPIQPLQPNPANNIQPATTNIFGSPTPPPPNANAPNPSAPLTGPGVMPPPIGLNNPLNNPVGGPNAGGNVIALPGGASPAPPQPAAPGTLPGATPGAAPTPGQVR